MKTNAAGIINTLEQFYKPFLNAKDTQLPISKTIKGLKHYPPAIVCLWNYIVFLSVIGFKTNPINEYVDNQHIAERFLEIIQGIILEIHMPEKFKRKQLNLNEETLKVLSGYPIEPKNPEAVHEIYQTFRQPDNPTRNLLKLMDIRMNREVMPFKSLKITRKGFDKKAKQILIETLS